MLTRATFPMPSLNRRILTCAISCALLFIAGCRGATTEIAPTAASLTDQTSAAPIDTTLAATVEQVIPTIDPNAPTVDPAAPVSGRDVAVFDEAGAAISKAAVRVFAPRQVKIGQTIEIRLEVSFYEFDPNYGQPNAPLTPQDLNIAATERQYMLVRPDGITGGIRAGNIAEFDVQAEIADGFLKVDLGALNVWRFNLTPKENAFQGRNVLEAYLFLPQIGEDAATLRESISVPFDIEVVP